MTSLRPVATSAPFSSPFHHSQRAGRPSAPPPRRPSILSAPGGALLGAERGLGMPAVLTPGRASGQRILADKTVQKHRDSAPQIQSSLWLCVEAGPRPSLEAGLGARSVDARPQGPLSMSQSQRPIPRAQGRRPLLGPPSRRRGPAPRAALRALGEGRVLSPVRAPSAVTVARSQGWEEGDCPHEDPRGCCQGPCMWLVAPDTQGHLSGHTGLPPAPSHSDRLCKWQPHAHRSEETAPCPRALGRGFHMH